MSCSRATACRVRFWCKSMGEKPWVFLRSPLVCLHTRKIRKDVWHILKIVPWLPRRQRREETRARRREDATAEAASTSCGRRRVMDETGAAVCGMPGTSQCCCARAEWREPVSAVCGAVLSPLRWLWWTDPPGRGRAARWRALLRAMSGRTGLRGRRGSLERRRTGGAGGRIHPAARRGEATQRPAGRGQRAAQAACGLPTACRQRRAAAHRRARRQMWL